jgi:hypothetical protein
MHVPSMKSYTLQGKDILHRLSLSLENYDHPVFIHPPIFVFLSALLVKLTTVPLPFVPLLMQGVGLSTMFGICCELSMMQLLLSKRCTKRAATLSRKLFVGAATIVLSCPILWLTSQKIWIDNALFLTTVVAVAGMMTLCRPGLTGKSILMRWIAIWWSGFGCLGLALNCKITAVALFPFMICWLALTTFVGGSFDRIVTGQHLLWSLFADFTAFMLGSVMGMTPWTIFYWV